MSRQVPTDMADALARAQRGELLGPMDVAGIFGIGRSRFQQLNQLGAFDCFKVRPALGPRCFAGVKVWRYVQGEASLEVPWFGRKRRA